MGSNAFNEIFDVIVDIIAAYALIAVIMHYGLIIIRAILVDILKIKIPEYIEVMASILLPALVTIDFAQDTMFSASSAHICVFLRTAVLAVMLVALLKWLYELLSGFRTEKNKQKRSTVSIIKKQVYNSPHPEQKVAVIKNNDNTCVKPVVAAIATSTKEPEPNCQYSNYGRATPSFKTPKGDYVHSPGEVMIASKLFDAGIPYEYQRKLQLGESFLLMPSFTISINNYGKRVFWEHFPSLKSDENFNRWKFKNRIYQMHNIFLGNNLFLTTDDDFREIAITIAKLKSIIISECRTTSGIFVDNTDDHKTSSAATIEEDIICDGRTFLDHFVTDLETFNDRLVIFSPFMAEARLHMLLPLFDRAVARGKQIVVVTKDISRRNKEDREKCRKLEPILRAHGVRIVYRGDMHEKLIFVDHDAVWVGSLNALSFTGTTGEVMHRHTDRKTVAEYAKMYQIDAIK